MHLLAANYFQEILKMRPISKVNPQPSDQIPNPADRSAEIREEFKEFLASSDPQNLLKILFKSILQENTENTIKAMDKFTSMEMVKLLVERGADINAKYRSDEGMTALMYAVFNNNFEAVELLLKHGADINAKDDHGRTPLMLAVNCGQLKMIKLLLDFGANINTPDKEGRTPLIQAAIKNNPKPIELLVEFGADINAQDKEGRIALSYAEHPEIIKFLFLKTTDDNLEETINQTAQFNPVSLPCMDLPKTCIDLPKNNISSVDNNLRKIIKNNISNLIKAVQSKESRIESLTRDEMESYIKSLMALANLAVFNISDHTDKEKIESSIKFAAANSIFIRDLFHYLLFYSNTATNMCYLGFLMTLTKLGFSNISNSTTITYTQENGAETIVTEILKITFQDKKSGESKTFYAEEPELKEYVFDFLVALNSPKSSLVALAKNAIKQNKTLDDKKRCLPKLLQEYIKQQPSSQEIIENIEILRGSRFQ